MKRILFFLSLALLPILAGAQTLADTTRFKAFDRSKDFVYTGAQLKTFVGSYTDEQAQDAVGGMVTGTLIYSDVTPSLGVKTQISVTGDGDGVKLTNDEASPGNFQFYGTDGSGVKGFHDPRPYKVYVANITQTGTDAPVATILENTLGVTPTWSRFGPGDYRLTSTGLFVSNKVAMPNSKSFEGGGGGTALRLTFWDRISADVIRMRCASHRALAPDNQELEYTAEGFTIEFRIYP